MQTGLLVLALRSEGAYAILYNENGEVPTLSEVYNFSDDLNIDSLAEKLSEIITSSGWENYKIVVSLGGAYSLYRSWELPFVGRQKILQALSFELEEEMPFAADDAESVFFIHEQRAISHVVTATARREFLDSLTAAFEQAGLALLGVLPAPFELQPLVAEQSAGEKVLALDINADSVSWMVVEDEGVLAAGFQPYGFHQSLDLHELEHVLLTDFSDADLSSDAVDMKERLGQFAVQLWRDIEVRQNLSEVVSVVLVGDILKFQSVDTVLQPCWGLPVTVLRPELEGIEYDRDSDERCLLGVLGVQRLLAKRRSFWRPLLLRTSVEDQSFGFLLKYTRWIVLAVFFLTALLLQQFLAGVHYSRLTEQLEASAQSVFHSAVPELPGKFGFTQMESILSERVEKLSADSSPRSGSSLKTLDFFSDINNAVPKSLDIIVDSISMDEVGCSLVGTARSYEDVEKLQKVLGKVPGTSGVKIGSAASVKGNKRVRFSIDVSRED